MIFALATTIIVIDQITKWLTVKSFGVHDYLTVIPGFFDLRRVYNRGAAWGMLSGQRFFLIAISIGMLFFIWKIRAEIATMRPYGRVGMGLLIGGIIGNLIDRIKLGYVIDFLDFHWHGFYTFPTFNIADSAIFLGVLLYFIHTLIHSKPQSERS